MRSYMMKRIYLLLLLPLLIGCNQKQKTESSDSVSESEQASETPKPSESLESSESEEEPDTRERVTATITFRNGGFTTSTFEKDTTQNSFIAWFNNHENADGLLTSIVYDNSNYYAQMNYIGNEGDANRFSTLILGSQSKNGLIKFNFSHLIESVTCTVQAYSKYISYSDSYSVDTNSVFNLNQTSQDLSLPNGYSGPTEEVQVNATINPEATNFSISSTGGRVFVHEMVITYLGDN